MGRRVFPRKPGLFDTVFGQPEFWLVLIVVTVILGVIPAVL